MIVSAREPVPVLLIHGAWAGAWVWSDLAPFLTAAGHPVHALDLPGDGSDSRPPEEVTLEETLAAILAQVDRHPGPVALVAHSGGGVLAGEVAEARPDRISHLVYVAGIMLPDGRTFGEVVADLIPAHPEAAGIGPHLAWSKDRRSSTVPPAAAQEIFFNDCPPDIARAAAARLTAQPEGARAVRPRLSAGRFGRVPRLYIAARRDRSIVPAAQAAMQALVPGARVATLDSGHAPQVAMPDRLAAALLPFLASRPDLT